MTQILKLRHDKKVKEEEKKSRTSPPLKWDEIPPWQGGDDVALTWRPVAARLAWSTVNGQSQRSRSMVNGPGGGQGQGQSQGWVKVKV